MIYSSISFYKDPFDIQLHFDSRITFIEGDSGAGKTFLYQLLQDAACAPECIPFYRRQKQL